LTVHRRTFLAASALAAWPARAQGHRMPRSASSTPSRPAIGSARWPRSAMDCLRTARQMRIAIPQSLSLRADDVIS
jgi:hypothetical protein